MHHRLYSPDGSKELATSLMLFRAGSLVQDAIGWAMGDQNVSVVWDGAVELRSIRFRGDPKGFGLDRSSWRAPDLQAHNLYPLVDQKGSVRETWMRNMATGVLLHSGNWPGFAT
jgi:hypothetical protein